MVTDGFRLNDKLLVEQDENGYVLKFRDEVGRGKRFGMDGAIPMSETTAETFAKWIFARQIDGMDDTR